MTAINKRIRKRLFGSATTMPCAYCGIELTWHEATLDHVRPKMHNGRTTDKNGAIACRPCNQKKGHGSVNVLKKEAHR